MCLKKTDMICWLVCDKHEFIINNIKSIKKTNIAYVKKVRENDYLILEEYEYVFINVYNEKIKLKHLEKYLKDN